MDDPRDDLERYEVEDALRFMMHQFTDDKLVHADLNATLKALIDTLIETGALRPEPFERRRQRNLDAATTRLVERPLVKLDRTVDKYALTALPDIDCAALIPLCKARCCKLTVCLSRQDLDEREIVWDYGKPYQIRKKEDAYCWHSQPETRGCGVYQRRPAVCRTYDCRGDHRIWKDFENRIPQDDA
jgi:Fe-S-cluster containining protein